MPHTHFAVEDNPDKLFSLDDVKLSFHKDPHVGRVWAMSHEQLIDLKTAITTYLTAKRLG